MKFASLKNNWFYSNWK